MIKLNDIFNEFTKIQSVSGYESLIQKHWIKILKSNNIKVECDTIGNAYGFLNTKSNIKCMIDAHCDEIGGIVQYINEKGFIFFSKIGGVGFYSFPGQRVCISGKEESVLGIICKNDSNNNETDGKNQASRKLDGFYIDIGAKSFNEVKEIIEVGDPISYINSYHVLKNDFVTTSGADNKAGLAVITYCLLELAKLDLPITVIAVSTVQEEIGLRGAKARSFKIKPDINFSVDVIETTDYPFSTREKNGEIFLGKGPVISRGPNIHPHLFELLVNVAQKNNIPYQIMGLPSTYTTNAGAIQTSREGVATALINIPIRYIHSPSEIVSLDDIDNTAKLLKMIILEIDDMINLKPY